MRRAAYGSESGGWTELQGRPTGGAANRPKKKNGDLNGGEGRAKRKFSPYAMEDLKTICIQSFEIIYLDLLGRRKKEIESNMLRGSRLVYKSLFWCISHCFDTI